MSADSILAEMIKVPLNNSYHQTGLSDAKFASESKIECQVSGFLTFGSSFRKVVYLPELSCRKTVAIIALPIPLIFCKEPFSAAFFQIIETCDTVILIQPKCCIKITVSQVSMI